METAVKPERYFTNHLQAFIDMVNTANETRGFPTFRVENNALIYDPRTGNTCRGTLITRDFMFGTTEYKFDENGMFIP